MKSNVKVIFEDLLLRYPNMEEIRDNLEQAYEIIKTSYLKGGKLLVCGNGGSAADADHIVGELMKGFKKKRPLPAELLESLINAGMQQSCVDSLQMSLPAINLSAHTALLTASINDLHSEIIYAQQVIGYGHSGDTLLGISTSGNSKNVVAAMIAAKAIGLMTIGMTGAGGGKLCGLCDTLINVPALETDKIQELHLPVYHALCAMIEEEFF
jgi:phosphoheptose isomerase